MKVLVTGSTGYLGSALVAKLLAEDHQVIAVARSCAKAAKYLGESSNLEVAEGDVTDVSSFASYLPDCDVVYHVAAYFKEYTGFGADEERLQKTNVDAVTALLDACSTYGVPTVVHVSSIGTIGAGTDESAPYNDGTVNRYFQSKIRAERAIAAWREKNSGVRILMVLPGAIIGPGDNGPTMLGRGMIDIVNGKSPILIPGALNVVDVRDVVDVMVAAAQRGKDGERYLAVGKYISLADFSIRLSEASGRAPPSVRAPYPVMWLAAVLCEGASYVAGIQPFITRVILRSAMDAVGHPLSGEKAAREFDISYRPIEESLKDEVEWFRKAGML